MQDPRIKKLADLLIGYSINVQPGERVLIWATEIPSEMIVALINRITEAGGIPFVEMFDQKVTRALYLNGTEEQMEILRRRDMAFMQDIQCYVALHGGNNITELADVPDQKMKLAEINWLKPVKEYRVNKTKWVVVRWPTPSMAQLAGMSTEAFENFYFDVCTLDYRKMAEAEQALKERMERADKVHIIGPLDTDLTFSIKGISAIPCVGDCNIPDGELFTAPVKDSVNGVMHFNSPAMGHGKPIDDIRFVFKDGKIIEATASDTKTVNEILDTDEGARYLGEFSFGFNPHITKPMRDTLFDEKMAGSLHLTPGNSYEEAGNGNKSSIHWDLVLIQREEYGGGEVYFDGELIRKDGRFVPDYLQCLNPENLI